MGDFLLGARSSHCASVKQSLLCTPCLLFVTVVGLKLRCVLCACCVLLRTDERKLDEELAWAASRPSSLWSGPPPRVATHGVQIFEDCLSEFEKGVYEEYVRRLPGCVYSLNQNPDVRCVHAKGKVPRADEMVFKHATLQFAVGHDMCCCVLAHRC